MSPDLPHIPHIPTFLSAGGTLGTYLFGIHSFPHPMEKPQPTSSLCCHEHHHLPNDAQFSRELWNLPALLCASSHTSLSQFQVDPERHLLTERLLSAVTCSHLPCHSGLQEMKILLLLQGNGNFPAWSLLTSPPTKHLRCCSVY